MRWVRLLALCALILFWHFSSADAKGPRKQGPIVTLDFQDLEQQNTGHYGQGRVYGGALGRNPADPFAADACLLNAESCFMLVARHSLPSVNPPDFKTRRNFESPVSRFHCALPRDHSRRNRSDED